MPKRVLFPVVALLLSALIVALGWQNHQLRQINAQMAAQLQNMRLEAHGLSLGSRPEALALRTTQHTHVNIGGARDAPQILYFFSTTCRYCLASMPQLQQIAAARGRSELIGVGLPLTTNWPTTPDSMYCSSRSPSTVKAMRPSATAPRSRRC